MGLNWKWQLDHIKTTATILLLALLLGNTVGEDVETDNESSRKVLGSSVVTSVSVIMDTGTGTKAVFADAVGRPVSKPPASQLASPINLLNPDRYEFYTFDDNGELVKRLMTLKEIQGIIASGDGDGLTYNSQSLSSPENYIPEKKVDDVVTNVQNVLKEEIETHKNPDVKPLYDTPDVSSSWTMILPAIFGNSGEDITPNKPLVVATPDTIMLEPTSYTGISKIPYSTSPKPSPVSSAIPLLDSSYIEALKNEQVSKIHSSSTQATTFVPIRTTYKKPSSTTIKKTSTKPPSSKPFIDEMPSLKDSQILTTPSTRKPTSDKPLITKVPLLSQKPSKPSAEWKKPISVIKKPTSATVITTTTSKPPIISIAEYKNVSSSTKVPDQSYSPTLTVQVTTSSAKSTGVDTTTEQVEISPENPTTSLLYTLLNIKYDDKSTNSSTNSINNPTTTNIPEEKFTVLPIVNFIKTQNAIEMIDKRNKTDNTTVTAIPTETTTNEVQTQTTEKALPVISTTVSPSGIEKLAVTELLDQLLLTSTNIYQLNTELAQPTTDDQRFDTSADESTIAVQTELNSLGVTIIPETNATPAVANDLPQEAATEQNVISSIEQLISQATQTVELPPSTTKDGEKVEQLLFNISNKPMEQVQSEAATVVSQLIGNLNPTLSNSEGQINNETILPTDETILTESFGSLISQIVGGDLPGLTTIDDLSTSTSSQILERIDNFDTELQTEKSTIVQDQTTEDDLYTTSTVNKEQTTVQTTNTESASKQSSSNIDVDPEESFNQYQSKHSITDLEKEILEEQNSTATESIVQANFSATTEFNDIITEEGNTRTESTEAVAASTTQIVDKTTQPGEQLPSDRTTFISVNMDREPSVPTESTVTFQQTTLHRRVPSSTPSIFTTTYQIESTQYQKISEKNQTETSWALVPTIPPYTNSSTAELPLRTAPFNKTSSVNLVPHVAQAAGLDDTTTSLDIDVYKFVELCNELSFGFWKSVTDDRISASRSVVISPFAATSLLAMVFLGARGATSGEMNEILKLDDMVTFNPHMIFRNVTESIEVSKKAGVAVSAIIRELYSDKSKGKLLSFYKERARQFYDGHVEETSFKEINDVIRRRTNLLVKRYTWGKIPEFLKDSTITVHPPLAGVSASIFHTDCSTASTQGRDGELHFVVSPSIRQRRLVPIPAAVWRSDFLAGYEPGLDATAVAIGTKDQLISTIFVMPGQQGIAAPGDGLARLERYLVENAFTKGSWKRLLRSLIPRPGLEVQIPRFSHKSVINATLSLQQMGLKDLFNSKKANLRGLNGVAHEMYLSDVIQVNNFATCGEGRIDETHHIEFYPTTSLRSSRHIRNTENDSEINANKEPVDYQRAFKDPLYDPNLLALPLPLRPRQARIPEIPRLRFDRPFLYFVRHNPTGLLLHMGRFNPRLLP